MQGRHWAPQKRGGEPNLLTPECVAVDQMPAALTVESLLVTWRCYLRGAGLQIPSRVNYADWWAILLVNKFIFGGRHSSRRAHPRRRDRLNVTRDQRARRPLWIKGGCNVAKARLPITTTLRDPFLCNFPPASPLRCQYAAGISSTSQRQNLRRHGRQSAITWGQRRRKRGSRRHLAISTISIRATNQADIRPHQNMHR